MNRLSPADLPLLIELESACAWHPWSESALREALQARHTSVWALDRRAYCIERSVVDEAEVLSIGVRPEQRRQGLGRQLLERVQQSWQQRGVVGAFLEVREANTGARGLYSSLGWEEIGRRTHYYGPQEHAVLMRWTP